MQKAQTSDNFWARVAKNGKLLSDCWEWTGYRIAQGYGQVSWGDKILLAHRVAYELTFGAIPEGKEIHHTCENRACCNPYHLRVVTRRENQLLSNSVSGKAARQTHCRHGHEFTEANTYRYRGYRYCVTCRKAKRQRSSI